MTNIITTTKIVTMITATITPTTNAPALDPPVAGWLPPPGKESVITNYKRNTM